MEQLALRIVMDEYIAIYGNEKSIVMVYCYGLLLWSWSIASLIKSIASLIKSIVSLIKSIVMKLIYPTPPPSSSCAFSITKGLLRDIFNWRQLNFKVVRNYITIDSHNRSKELSSIKRNFVSRCVPTGQKWTQTAHARAPLPQPWHRTLTATLLFLFQSFFTFCFVFEIYTSLLVFSI